MHILILKNISYEGPGTIEDYLLENNIKYTIVDLSSEPMPSSEDFDALVIMGGPMSVNDTDRYPYIAEEIDLVQDFIKKGKKVFGICLGAQIMAKALGSEVYPGKEKEIGWYDIEVNGNGIKDLLITKLAVHPRAGDYWKKFKVFHWHGETYDMPSGAERLAKSDLYPNQAFRFGEKAYAFQFHIEAKKEMIYEWLKNEAVDLVKIKRETELFYEDYSGRAKNFYRAFFK